MAFNVHGFHQIEFTIDIGMGSRLVLPGSSTQASFSVGVASARCNRERALRASLDITVPTGRSATNAIS